MNTNSSLFFYFCFIFTKKRIKMTDQVKKYAIIFGNFVMLPLIYFRLGQIGRELAKN